jgi:hypothetical protein
MRNEYVIKALIENSLSVTELAKRTGYTRVFLSRLINGHEQSMSAKYCVAKALGKNVHELWHEDHVVSRICMSQDSSEGND